MISVIVPVFNGADLLPEAVASIRSQGYSPLEIIVVDDGSTDDIADVARDLGPDVRYLYQENRGPAAARNRGIRMARGEIVGFVDHDDLWAPGAVSALLPSLSRADAVLGRSQILIREEDDQASGRRPKQGRGSAVGRFRPFSRPWRSWHLSSGLFQRRLFRRVGFFDESFQYLGDDLDWVVRLREVGAAIEFVDPVIHLYRIHGRNNTRGADFRRRNVTEIVKKAIDRRRSRRLPGDGRGVQEIPHES